MTELMALQAPPELLGIHTNMPCTVPDDVAKALLTNGPPPELSPEERHAYEQLDFFFSSGLAYAQEMSHRPQTLYGIDDSPIGLAAWMLDHDARSYELIVRDFNGQQEGLTRDDVLDNVTLYWLTNTGVSAARLYWESAHKVPLRKLAFFAPRNVTIPVAVTAFPDEIYQAPRSWTARAYPKLVYYNKADKGGATSRRGNSRSSSRRRCGRRSARFAENTRDAVDGGLTQLLGGDHGAGVRRPEAHDCDPLARQALAEAWPPLQYLRSLLDAELATRAERAIERRLHAARLPAQKTGLSRRKRVSLAALFRHARSSEQRVDGRRRWTASPKRPRRAAHGPREHGECCRPPRPRRRPSWRCRRHAQSWPRPFTRAWRLRVARSCSDREPAQGAVFAFLSSAGLLFSSHGQGQPTLLFDRYPHRLVSRCNLLRNSVQHPRCVLADDPTVRNEALLTV